MSGGVPSRSPFHPDRPDPGGAGPGGSARHRRPDDGRRRVAGTGDGASHGFYVPDRGRRRTIRTADRRGGRACSRRTAASTGWAALHWLGGRWFDGLARGGRTREMSVCDRVTSHRAQPGIAICEEKLDPRDLTVVDGLRVTTALRSVLLRDALRADRAAWPWWRWTWRRTRTWSPSTRSSAYAAAHSSWTGIPQCPRCDPARRRERVVAARGADAAGVDVRRRTTTAAVQRAGLRPRRAPHRHARPARPGRRESWASTTARCTSLGRQRADDIEREAAFRAVGLEYVTMVAADLHRIRPTSCGGSVRRTTGRSYEPESRRALDDRSGRPGGRRPRRSPARRALDRRGSGTACCVTAGLHEAGRGSSSG